MAKKKVHKFVLLSGTHRQTEDGVNKTYTAQGVTLPNKDVVTSGHIVESPHNLIKAFPLKFEQYRPPVADLDDLDDDDETEDAAPTESTAAADKPLGEDVTAKFDSAKDNGLLVFYSKSAPRGYTVIDTDDPGTPVNAEPAKKKEVGAVIENYLNG